MKFWDICTQFCEYERDLMKYECGSMKYERNSMKYKRHSKKYERNSKKYVWYYYLCIAVSLSNRVQKMDRHELSIPNHIFVDFPKNQESSSQSEGQDVNGKN